MKLIENGNTTYALVPVGSKIYKNGEYEPSTAIYKVSRILKGLQYTIDYNITRLWNDNLAEEPTEDVGRDVMSGILVPALIRR